MHIQPILRDIDPDDASRAFVHGPRPCKYGALARQATVRADNGHGPGPKLSRGARHQRVNGHRPAIAGAAAPPLRQINSDSRLTATHTLRYKGRGEGGHANTEDRQDFGIGTLDALIWCLRQTRIFLNARLARRRALGRPRFGLPLSPEGRRYG